MNRILLGLLTVFVTTSLWSSALAAPKADRGNKELVFVSYPDPAEFLTADILRRVGDAYEREHPEARVTVKTGLGYLASRELVIEGKATAMMISEMLNAPRAYQTQHSVSGAHAEHELKLDKFLPIGARIIRSEEKQLAKMRMGLVTDRISNKLRHFLDFLGSESAGKSVAALPHVELIRPSKTSEKIKKVHYKRQGVTLRKPILMY